MNVKTGIQTSHILAINSANYANNGDINHSRSAFEQEVIKIKGVEAATSSSYIPGSNIASFMPTRLTWKTEDDNVSCRMNFVGYDYIPIFEHKLIAGRNFSKDFPTDSNAIIINKTLARLYGFMNVEEALGKEIYWTFRNENRHIIGVMEDFHHQSAEMPLEQTMFQLWDQARGYCLLKINTNNSQSTIKEVENLWKKVHTGNAFEFFWIDDHYHKQFEKWTEYLMLIRALSIIIILIACVGLFGLSSMLLNKRTKEIGIRRVNGARTTEVMAMLNRDFIKWVAISFIFACPIAWYAMHKWLENFAYKTTLSWWVFAAAGVIAMLVALLTVSWQSWRAATRNPVESLRYE
jgi:putative ABC transport system permease protein